MGNRSLSQREQFFATLKEIDLPYTYGIVKGATLGSRLAFRFRIQGFGAVYLSADRRVTKVVTPSRTWIRPTADERASIFQTIRAADMMVKAGAKVVAAA